MESADQKLELLSRQLHRAHRAAVGAELARRGLSEVNPLLVSILRHLEQSCERGVSQRELAQMMRVSPAAVTNSLKIMERGGYIHRTPQEEDARRNRVELTEKGRAAVEGCEAAFLSVSQRMLAGFTPEEQRMLGDFRSRMLQNLRGETPREKEES